jgi:hypothetical protein
MTMRDQALTAALAHSAEHRVGISEVRGSKPRRSTIPPSLPRLPGREMEGGRPGSPIGRGASLRRKALGVRILLGTPLFARVRKSAKRVGSNPTVWRFDFSREHQFLRSAAVAQLAEAAGLNPVQCRIVACLRHQLPALPLASGIDKRRLAQRKSVGPTNRRSRYRNSQRLPIKQTLL